MHFFILKPSYFITIPFALASQVRLLYPPGRQLRGEQK